MKKSYQTLEVLKKWRYGYKAWAIREPPLLDVGKLYKLERIVKVG